MDEDKSAIVAQQQSMLQKCIHLHKYLGASIKAIPTQQDIAGVINRLHKCLDLLSSYDPALHTPQKNKQMYRIMSDILRAVALFHGYKSTPHVIQSLFDWYYIDRLFEIVEVLEVNRSDIEADPAWSFELK